MRLKELGGRGVQAAGRVTSPLAVFAVALLSVLVATALAYPFGRTGAQVAVALYLLGVVASAAAAGLWGGLIAAVASSAGLALVFTSSRSSSPTAPVEEFVAAAVFVAVAVVVGLLVSRALAERARASERERDARLLGYLAVKLLSGEPLDRALADAAAALLDPFGLVAIAIDAKVGDRVVSARAVREGADPGERIDVPIAIGGVTFGTMAATRSAGARPFGPTDRGLLEAAAKQMAVALERARLGERVRSAQVEAEASLLRAAMFSSVTHDLRTPLASIKASVTSLLSDEVVYDRVQKRDLLTTILEETDRLNRLVGNIMDLARVRAGALTPLREPTDVEEMVQAVINRLRQALPIARFRAQIRPDLPEIFVDPVMFDQVLTNLLENAVRYSPSGSEVVVSAAQYRDAVQIRVADQGPGIPEARREQVFDAFYRGDAGPERPGTGLGLAIVAAIATAHDGRAWVEGAPAGGAVLVVEFPVVQETA